MDIMVSRGRMKRFVTEHPLQVWQMAEIQENMLSRPIWVEYPLVQ